MKNNYTERRTSNGDRRKKPLFTKESQRLFQIMVVSEDHTPAEQLTLKLKKKGYQTFICSGQSDSNCFNEKHPDVIVICCDNECEKIKNQLKTADDLQKTPIILLKDEKSKMEMQEELWTNNAVFESLEDQLRSILINKSNPGIAGQSNERRKCDRRWSSVFQQTSEETQHQPDVPEANLDLPLVSISSQFSFKSIHDLFNLVLVSLHPSLYQNWLTELSWDTFISASSLRFDRPELMPIMLNHAQPNLLLLDMQGQESSLEIWLNAIRMADSAVDIILIVNDDFDDLMAVMDKLEISGILSVKDNACTVTRAIRSVIEGERWLPDFFKTKRMNALRAGNQTVHTPDKSQLTQHSFDEATLLTAYENTITQLVMLGLTVEQIAEELNAETQTISRHVMFLSNKLRFTNNQKRLKHLRRKLH
ncbi:LuxR C-terminal-related transcriptional regulator [Methylicorpusculum sp.]|uniref:LuxR C-terminal-related transcriptional regulator n=1 Tax=Methylicorpusculum sp. TaxID=2713644 RepID=UPI0027170388|nr:LuxR C-terminal-related transcriptional regulator [Methylicorpusculum sp.]MDO8846191.1 LuxR C-terminal-related transcriptional regulator [Methylicorpusculum sp.]